MPKLWLLFLAVYAASFASGVQERFQEEDSFQVTVKQAEEAAEATKEPFGDKNLQAAARFLSSKLRDDMHNGDKTKFFDGLDTEILNSDKEITLAEMEVVHSHAAKMAADDKGGGILQNDAPVGPPE